MGWVKIRDDRYATDDGCYWAQFLDYSPGECWALWRSQEQRPSPDRKRSGFVHGFHATLAECQAAADRDRCDGEHCDNKGSVGDEDLCGFCREVEYGIWLAGEPD